MAGVCIQRGDFRHRHTHKRKRWGDTGSRLPPTSHGEKPGTPAPRRQATSLPGGPHNGCSEYLKGSVTGWTGKCREVENTTADMKNDCISHFNVLRISGAVVSEWEMDLFSLLTKHEHVAGSFRSMKSSPWSARLAVSNLDPWKPEGVPFWYRSALALPLAGYLPPASPTSEERNKGPDKM